MELLLYKAKLAERAECYRDMTKIVKDLIEKLGSSEASVDIRNLVSVAYKNHVAEIRTSCRLLKQIEEKEQEKGLIHGAACVTEYREEIEKDLIKTCHEAIHLADKMLETCSDVQSKTFLLKMKADYNRYIAELPTYCRQVALNNAQKFYDEAMKAGLPNEHHVMLGVLLNKAIFYYEVLNKKSDAIAILKDIMVGSPMSTDGNKRNLPVIMNLIDDNLRLWEAGQQ